MDLIKKLQGGKDSDSDSEKQDTPVEDQRPQNEIVMDLHKQIEALCQSLSEKITSKNESLILRHEHFALYENTLNEKYDPVF